MRILANLILAAAVPQESDATPVKARSASLEKAGKHTAGRNFKSIHLPYGLSQEYPSGIKAEDLGPAGGPGMRELGASHVIPRDSPGKLNLIAWLVEMCDINE